MGKATLSVLGIAAVLAGCGGELLSQGGPDVKGQIMQLPSEVAVELDILSGGTNPSWKLTEPQREELIAKLKDLEALPPQTMFEGLGYRGFVLSPARAGAAPLQLRIYKGVIRYQAGENVTYWKDPDRHAERWLVSNARPHVDTRVYEEVRAQVG
jgi:hypothetical protein